MPGIWFAISGYRAASKFALRGSTESLRDNLVPDGIVRGILRRSVFSKPILRSTRTDAARVTVKLGIRKQVQENLRGNETPDRNDATAPQPAGARGMLAG